MILHLALFTWKPGVTTGQSDELARALHEMADRIPQIRSYTCGTALRLLGDGPDFAVAAVVDAPEDLAAYLGHPLHDAVQAALLSTMVAERQAIQIPLPPEMFGLEAS